MLTLPESVDQPITTEDGVPDRVVEFLARLNAAGETKLAGKWITFVKLRQPDQWLVQHEDGFLHQLVSVHRVEGTTVRTLSANFMPLGDVVNPCRVAVHICQVSGTCYFNTAVNVCCLGTRLARMTLKAVHRLVALCTEAERKSFFQDALDLTACPAQFTRLDLLRLLYALVSPLSPTKLAADVVGTRPQYNVMAEAIYALGHRRRTASAPGARNVGHVGGSSWEALEDLFRLLGISWQGRGGAARDPDVVVASAGKTVEANGHTYYIDSCVIVLTSHSERTAHTVTGFICDKRPYVCDSLAGVVIPFNWVRWLGRYKPKAMARAFLAEWDYHAEQTDNMPALPAKLADVDYGVYVRSSSERRLAKRPRLT